MIPSRRGRRLNQALWALARQSLDRKRFEVLVVRDPESNQRQLPVPDGLDARFLMVPTPCGPAAKRNVGWRAARASLVVFTDDDCEPDRGWLEALLEAHEGTPEAILQGRTYPNPRELEMMSPFTRTISVDRLGPWFPTCNVAYPRSTLERLGGFDESFSAVGGEDTDLACRAREAGHSPEFVPEAIVYHAVSDLGVSGKLAVAARWSGAVRVFRDHPSLREHLYMGLFWKRSHALLLGAALGLVACRRTPAALLLALPYGRDVRARMKAERASIVEAPFYPVHDLVELAATARGAARAGVAVL